MTSGTLVYIFRGDQILLAMKKRGFGAGKWNGVGGKLKDGETSAQAAMREAQEEIGVVPVLGEPLAVVKYHDSDVGDWVVHVFRTESYRGEPMETDEMKPQWFPVDQIPYDAMWSGDEKWTPFVVKNQPFAAEMWFDGQQKNVKSEVRAR